MGRSARQRVLGRAAWAAAWAIAGLVWAAGPAAAREGDSRAGLFIGTTTFAVDSYTTYGTTFGGSYGYEFQDELMWTLGGAFSSTNGQATVTDSAGA